MVTHLKEEQSLSDVLNELFSYILWEELDPELKLERSLFVDVLHCHLYNRENASCMHARL